MQAVELGEYGDYAKEALPDNARPVPSMMSEQEKRFLYRYTMNDYSGEGVIVDAGIFMGASTHCFAQGILASARASEITTRWPTPVSSYDHGVVSPGMVQFFKRHGVAGTWAAGESFESLIRDSLSPVSSLVNLHIGDITTMSWDGDPIEILFLDVLKTREIQRHCMKEFYPSLIPGRSLLIQQDYFYDGLPFVKVTQEALAPYFSYVGEVRSMAVFRCERAVPMDLTTSDPADTLDQASQVRMLEQCRDRSGDPDRRFMCELSIARHYAESEGAERGLAHLAAIRPDYEKYFSLEASPRLQEALIQTQNAVKRSRA